MPEEINARLEETALKKKRAKSRNNALVSAAIVIAVLLALGFAVKLFFNAWNADISPECAKVRLGIMDSGTCFNTLSNELYVRVNRLDIQDTPLLGVTFFLSAGESSKEFTKISGVNAEGILVLNENESQGIPAKNKPVDFVIRDIGFTPENLSVSAVEKVGTSEKTCRYKAAQPVRICF